MKVWVVMEPIWEWRKLDGAVNVHNELRAICRTKQLAEDWIAWKGDDDYYVDVWEVYDGI